MSSPPNSSQRQPVLRLSIDSQASSTSVDSAGKDGLPKAIVDKGYKLHEKLGSGAFSTVYKASNPKEYPGVMMACKRFDFSNKRNEVWKDKCLKSEMKIMMRLKHKNIVKAYDVMKTRTAGFIFMALAKNGSVGEYLEKTEKPIEESKAKKWFHDISSAINYLHSKGMAHRDIKPENFLLDNDSKDSLLSDFGFSCMALDNEKLLKGTNCGTDYYKSPELLTLVDGHIYDPKKSDMYAMGVSLFEMLNLVKPFDSLTDFDNENARNSYVQKQRSKKYHSVNKKVSQNAAKCIEALLEPDPDHRLTAHGLIRHKWFDTK